MRNSDTSTRPPGGDDRKPAVSPLLCVRGIRKAFPGVQALSDGSFELLAGEIHALVGENGAGKSTLIKILTGVQQADSGEIWIGESPVRFDSPLESFRRGIVAIYQEFSLIPALTVSANLFLGRERGRAGMLRRTDERRESRAVLSRLGSALDPDTRIADLSVSEQQLVEIARALLAEARILIMDEPTAALTPREVERLFAVLRELVRDGIGIVFVSHRLNEVLEISDRVTVMRDGVTVATRPTSELSRRELIELMVGRSLEEEFPPGAVEHGAVRLAVSGLTGGKVRDVSFRVRAGEILGIAGLMGAGRTELARLICGVDPRESGEILLDDRPVHITCPRDAIRTGICLLNEDRKGQGLVLCLSARDNFSLPNLSRWSRFGLLQLTDEAEAFDTRAKSLAIKLSGPHQRAENLSGGNQQKLLVARWLETDSQVIIFDEPTRGIDVGAKYEMYVIIRRLAAQGKAIVLISSELPEILGMCDRVLVMKAGRVAGEHAIVPGLTQEDIMALAV
ncbi:MAG: sugar ABC transporter ATP-binding protein [candidate division Zixibacteria bacterium]|jgi:ABC-type sugar transport system ATPase subunit|nr:sugar ABC transporter ATP-binding protein [candidate division Zixibacteria bacterium]